MNRFQIIKNVVAKIPKGRVTTYGAIAASIGIRDARQVGWAIWGNLDPLVPCHRVVNKDGKVAEDFSLGGWQEQKSRLMAEGISFIGTKNVDLGLHFWQP
jgi:methylated-DNA-protein-cysteine methyltransferase related protein